MAAAIPVILNAQSGPDGADSATTAIAAAFRAHGLEVELCVTRRGDDIATLVERILAGGASRLVAAGGDGTINAIAARLLDRDVVLGILPLGTLNHFARDMHIPVDIPDAVRVISEGHAIAVDAGEVNGEIFLNNSSLGLYPRIVGERDQARRRLGWGKWPALARATWHALRDPACFNAVICVDGEDLQRRTPFIFVGNNCYVLEGFGIGKRPRLDEGVLSLHVLRPKTPLGLVWLGMRALFGIGSHVTDFEMLTATDFRVESQRARIEIARDGEVDATATPVCYRSRPKALHVFAPRGGGNH